METDLCVLSIDTVFKNPSIIPIDPLNIKTTPPSTNDSNGYNTGLLKIVNKNNKADSANEYPTRYYPANAGNYIHCLSETIKNVTTIALSSIEFPNIHFLFSQAKGSNYFTLVIPKDKLPNGYDTVDGDFNSSEEDPIQFNTPTTDKDPYRITIVIPDGLYSYTTLIDQIQSTFNNINNAQYALGGTLIVPGGLQANNQANNASYPLATLNLSIWYNLVTFKIIITNTDLSYTKKLPFGIEFPAYSGPGPALPYTNYDFENKSQGVYNLAGTADSSGAIKANANLSSTLIDPLNQAQTAFLPLPVAFKKNLDTHPFDGNYNRSLGYLLGFRKTIYRIEDCRLQAGTDHQTSAINNGNGSIVQNTIYPLQPHIQAPNGTNTTTVGIPPGMGWISESPLDTQGDTYILMKLNDYGNIIHENNPAIFDQPLGFLKNSKGDNVKDTNGNLIPLKRRIYSRQQDKYFAKIILVSGKGNIIFDNGSNFISRLYNFKQPTDINKLHISLHEANGDLINLQGFDYSLTLEINYIRSSVLKKELEGGLVKISNQVPLLYDKNMNENVIPTINNLGLSTISNKYMNKKKEKKKKKFKINY
jgi:hypothetical protein